MYNLDEVKKDIATWIIDTLSTDNPAFNGMPPCPFAKKALLTDRIEVIVVDNDTDFKLTKGILSEGNDVVAYVFDPTTVTPAGLTNIAVSLNNKSPELIFLEDHPDETEQVQDFVCNQGKYACIFGAVRDGVLEAREYLKTTDYYNNWDEDYKQTVWSR